MAQSKKRILVVDDEKDVCRTLQLMLENYGFDTDCFTESAMALENFKPNLYDLSILDIKMEKPNGFVLYDELKPRDPKIKTLFITALNSVEPYNTRSSKVYPLSGKRHFMKKPVNTKDLLEQVYSMMSCLD
jgi:two-component system catabolic regulation response regulator CreB/two-component system response regulator ChvI